MRFPLAGAVLLVAIDRGTRDMTVIGRVTEGHLEVLQVEEAPQLLTEATVQMVVRLRDMPNVEPVLRVAPEARFSSDPWRRRGKRRGRGVR